jgi:hypothetical protein
MYRLVTLNAEYSLTLYTADEFDRKAALLEIKAWAEQHNWQIACYDGDPDANCQIQQLIKAQSL